MCMQCAQQPTNSPGLLIYRYTEKKIIIKSRFYNRTHLKFIFKILNPQFKFLTYKKSLRVWYSFLTIKVTSFDVKSGNVILLLLLHQSCFQINLIIIILQVKKLTETPTHYWQNTGTMR